MNDLEFNERLGRLENETNHQERCLKAITSSLTPPLIFHNGTNHWGFRFARTTPLHLGTLKMARAISGLNASIALIRAGYSQEMCSTLRGVIECLSYMEFIVAGTRDELIRSRVERYSEQYFDDYRRGKRDDYKGKNLSQEKLHKDIESSYLKFFEDHGITRFDESPKPTELLFHVYRNLSSYVHARYPEVMDMWHGENNEFSVRGMSNSAKDFENLEITETYCTSATLTIISFLNAFELGPLIKHDPELMSWVDSRLSGNF